MTQLGNTNCTIIIAESSTVEHAFHI